MGTLQYALLGMLNRQPLTGYDLARAFQTTLGEFWSAKHSQIYPELKALAQKGLVEYETEISGTVLEKKVYTITPAGRACFQAWAGTRFPSKPLPKDEFRLQLFFSDTIPPEERLALLTHQLHQHRARLEELRSHLGKFSTIPPEEESAFSDYLVLLGGITREESQVSWLTTCLRLCRERMPGDGAANFNNS